jgi:Uncharacterized conserved protein
MRDFKEDMSSKIDGYLLGCLSEEDQEEFEAELCRNPDLQQELSSRNLLANAVWIGKYSGKLVEKQNKHEIRHEASYNQPVETIFSKLPTLLSWVGVVFAAAVAVGALIYYLTSVRSVREEQELATVGELAESILGSDTSGAAPIDGMVASQDSPSSSTSATVRDGKLSLKAWETKPLKGIKVAEEDSAWAATERFNTCQGFKSFISRYPQSAYRRLAEENIAKLCVPTPLESLPQPIRSLQANMVRVEGGEFNMGCQEIPGMPCSSWEKPVHLVRVPSFSIGRYEVTQAQWRSVMGAKPPTLLHKGCDNCPVEGVSWVEVQEFLSKLNQMTNMLYRLPSEAEWEFAARGGVQSKGYIFSGSDNLSEVAWSGTHEIRTSQPVGMKKSNELGLYDMSGNVFEWVQDCFNESYVGAPTDGTAWQSSGNCELRVVRGGSWNPLDPMHYCLPSFRLHFQIRSGVLGFRLASD